MLRMLRKKGRILVLDDDPAMQRLVATLLRRNGYVVDVVSAGAQAIEKIDRQSYAALLLDVMTPTEGGLTVIRHLRTARPDLLKRVVLVTASPESILRTVTGEIHDIVRKPFEAAELLGVVERVTRQ